MQNAGPQLSAVLGKKRTETVMCMFSGPLYILLRNQCIIQPNSAPRAKNTGHTEGRNPHCSHYQAENKDMKPDCLHSPSQSSAQCLQGRSNRSEITIIRWHKQTRALPNKPCTHLVWLKPARVPRKAETHRWGNFFLATGSSTGVSEVQSSITHHILLWG